MSEVEQFIIDNQEMLTKVMKSVKEGMVITTQNIPLETIDIILDQVDNYLDNFVVNYLDYLKEED